jgi:FMN phosphatase YigB (HAD superfamily)
MQNSKPVVLFDIDYTLFDKDLFLDSLYGSIGNLFGISIDGMKRVGNAAYEECTSEFDHFEPKYFSQKIAEGLGKMQFLQKIENEVLNKYNSPGSLYSETLKTIEEISEVARIGILSKGQSVFQRNKIYKFKNLLDEDHIYITDDKYKTLLNIINKYKGIKLYLVDDLLDILYSAKKLKSDIVTVWVKRGIYAQNREPIPGFKPDVEVENLSEVVKIVKSNL